ncbi:glucose-6-phosphate dehydrogenase [Salinibacterium sp. NK8237]|uniref:glucose-6-phosphate dehydrogenase n=1 Tax=Salinibacterium sp. NK8237 TaxID=2792038 RepID=UPI0018CE0044|nr:glucose-6-phosphate dehydrogenase [Salinibacterium sp. NK8237]MBH0129401.1 glucose-6-phosphate dehydrogenase [Salinibacterium sp. NK8237]
MTARIDTLIILGAGGDLTSRLLLPGLASYLASGEATTLALIGVDRQEMDDAAWQKRVAASFATQASSAADAVASAAHYVQADVTNAQQVRQVIESATGRVALYFALPPAIAQQVVSVLATFDLPEGIVLALEKPFGSDEASARDLNRVLQTIVPEQQIFRVDHFLGKSTVLNLIGLRFANRVFEPLLAAPNVAKVELIFDEALALEGRAGYYDRAGAVVDMIQSHLLLVMALTAMEPPASVSAEDLRGSMAQVLRATRVQTADGTCARRARYTAGTIGDRTLPAYVDEDGVNPDLGTETLAEVTFEIDNWRWAGVPFVLRSGKAIGKARQDIVITFAPVPHLPYGLTGSEDPAKLTISIKPATLELDLIVNGAGDPFTLDRTQLTTTLGDPAMSAYGEVIASLVDGDPVLSVRGDVAEQCWRIVAPVIDAFRNNQVPLEEYPAGSPGPESWKSA